MERELNKKLSRMEKRRRLHKLWHQVLTVCAAAVVFCTTYALILPAITWDRTLICQDPNHDHVPACYDAPPASGGDYICGKEEHTHDESCLFPDGSLRCTLETHCHSDSCLPMPTTQEQVEPATFCGMLEHTHSEDGCYDEAGQLNCGKFAHTHTERCFVSFAAPMLAGAEDPTPIFKLPPMITAEPQANEWQVVSGRYLPDESSAQIIVDADGNVLRLRKNLVPTGIENEFYVYLSVEPVFYHQWEEIFAGSGILLNSANNTASYGDKEVSFTNSEGINAVIKKLTGSTSGMQGHSSLLVPAVPPYTDSNGKITSTYTNQTGFDVYIGTIILQRFAGDPNPIRITGQRMVFSFSQGSTDSFTIIYCAPNSNTVVKLSNIHWDGKGGKKSKVDGTLTFPPEAYELLIKSNTQVFDHISQRTIPQLVTDPMGEHIEYLGLEYCSTGDSTVSFADNTLRWDLSGTEVEASQNPDDYEQINKDDAFSRNGAYQLVYKIRLKVTDPDFVSAAAQMTAKSGPTVNPTNGQTTLTYRTDKMAASASARTAQFRVPEVRGVLYDVWFRKLDQYSLPVPGAVFTLTDNSGTVIGTITTGTNEVYTFSDLPWGIYHLTEAAPENYSVTSDSMVGNQSWTIPLCYTASPDVLIPDTGRPDGNMLYNGGNLIPFDKGALKITNYKFSREFQLRKIGPDRSPLAGAQFVLYTDEALTQEAGANLPASNDQGVFTGSGFVLPAGTYYLVETAAPDGFTLVTSPGVLTVYPDGSGFRLFWNGRSCESNQVVDGFHTVFFADVVNEYSVPLPETGGRGMAPIVIIGILMLVLTWSYFIVHCRKKAGDRPGS